MGFFSGGKSTSSNVSGWESMQPWGKTYSFENLFPVLQSEAAKGYDGANYQDFVAKLSPQQLQAISTMTSGEPLGGGGMTGGLTGVQSMDANAGVAPEASGFFKQAGDALSQGLSGITQADVQEFVNPYIADQNKAIDDTTARLRSVASATLAKRGGAAFGSTAAGNYLADVETQGVNKKADINYNMFNNAMEQVQRLRDRAITGASTGGNLAGEAQSVRDAQFANRLNQYKTEFGMGQDMTNTRLNAAQTALTAGNAQQANEQSLLDAALRTELEKKGFKGTQLDTALERLKAFQSGVSSSTQKSGGLGNMLLSAAVQGAASSWAGG